LIGAGQAAGGALPSGVRIALFSCLLLLALYVLYITLQMRAEPPVAAASAETATQSAWAGGQADKTLASLRAALSAAEDVRRRAAGRSRLVRQRRRRQGRRGGQP
jgi:hypothetical protein